jgi:ribonuclease HI
VLEATDGSSTLEAADDEPEISRDRLELLAIVRGLEALDQRSNVTIVTASRYICRGLRFGLPCWKEDGWQWERFGQLAPVKNADLWRRVDHAMQFHKVHCQYNGGTRPSPQLQVESEVKNIRPPSQPVAVMRGRQSWRATVWQAAEQMMSSFSRLRWRLSAGQVAS